MDCTQCVKLPRTRSGLCGGYLLSDEDKFIAIMHSADSKTVKLLYKRLKKT